MQDSSEAASRVDAAGQEIQAVLVAGDGGASRSINGESKAFLQIAGRPMVVHVLEALLLTPQVSEVFVVGDSIRLEEALTEAGCRTRNAQQDCRVHIVPQGKSLVENVLQGFERTLPPGPPDACHPVLVLPCDIPFVAPWEISQFLERAYAAQADYVIGLSSIETLAEYAPRKDQPGIQMASFNLDDGRYRQNNLHFVRPLRVGNCELVQVMYENRYQKELVSMLRVIWPVFLRDVRNLWVIWYYLILHIGGVLHRRGHLRAADWVRRFVSIETAERAISHLLKARTVCVITTPGGAVLDIDKAEDLCGAQARLPRGLP